MPVAAAVAMVAVGAASAYSSNKSQKAALAQAGAADALQYEIASRQLDIGEEQWDLYKDTYLPLEREIAAMAEEPPDYAGARRRAIRDVEGQFSVAEDITNRNMTRYGINPASPQYVETNRNFGVHRAAARAGAVNESRRQEDDKQWARRITAVGLGKGLPSAANSAYGAAGNIYGRSADRYTALAGQYGQGISGGMQAIGYGFGQLANNWGS